MSKLSELAAELRAISERLDAVLADLEPDNAVPAWITAKLEQDGAWRPEWLDDLNAQARRHVPSGFINNQGSFRSTPMSLIHSVLWWPIYEYRADLDAVQLKTYARAQVDGFGIWVQAAASRYPIIPLPREGEDRLIPAGSTRWAVLAAAAPENGALKTEDELRACIVSLYRSLGFLPAE